MGTNNFTDIAKFVAKSAYTYVICNTYIHRVYISLSVVALSMCFIGMKKNLEGAARSRSQESESMNQIS